jgi:L-alanine-DL-glutamate epimerase-like enolase superfamily enzyme
MKIERVETLHADGGRRPFSFVKVTSDQGLIGWSEYTSAVGNAGIDAAIARLGGLVLGQDPRRVEWADAIGLTRTIPVWNGIAAHARGALSNALLDLSAKAAGVPVHALFGGKLRDRVAVYWSHFCGPRINDPHFCGLPEVRSYDQIAELAAEAEARGFPAVKMNFFLHDGTRFVAKSPGHGVGTGFPELNPDAEMFRALDRQLDAIRKGSERIGLMVDMNFNFKREGFRQILHRLEDRGMVWAEIDCYDPASMALLNRDTRVPLAGGEALIGRRGWRPYLEGYAYDVAIVDAIWNGFLESYKIAAMAEVYETNIALHNFYGALADHISGSLAAVVPNFRIMEYEGDDVPWRHEFFSHPTVIENGAMVVPDRPGWGTDVVEEAVRARPWRG